MAGTFWFDFDGTLAYRPSMWAEACIDMLDHLLAGHGLAHVDVEVALGAGMPWHRPDLCHEDLNDPQLWWHAVAARTQEALAAFGVTLSTQQIAGSLRRSITDPERYQLFDDTVEALELVAARGWCAGVVSNHIPELEDLLVGLGIRRHFDWVITSATLGFEKPHAAVFEMALARTTAKPVWMLGDNVEADCLAATRHGARAVLVRSDDTSYEPRTPTLLAAVQQICGSP